VETSGGKTLGGWRSNFFVLATDCEPVEELVHLALALVELSLVALEGLQYELSTNHQLCLRQQL